MKAHQQRDRVVFCLSITIIIYAYIKQLLRFLENMQKRGWNYPASYSSDIKVLSNHSNYFVI